MLCIRRIRERRWIRDDELDDPDWVRFVTSRQRATDVARRRLQQQRDQQQNSNEHSELHRTQEDAIREQFLTSILARFTMVRELESSRFVRFFSIARTLFWVSRFGLFSFRSFSLCDLNYVSFGGNWEQ